MSKNLATPGVDQEELAGVSLARIFLITSWPGLPEVPEAPMMATLAGSKNGASFPFMVISPGSFHSSKPPMRPRPPGSHRGGSSGD